MVRTAKNSFVPINRIPPEVLSLIPEHRETDKQLVTLTHVCRRWRDIFISCPPLWTSLDCIGREKTHVYLERSKESPLRVWFRGMGPPLSSTEAFLLTLPHIGRLRTMTLSGIPRTILKLTEHLVSLASPAPLLEKLEIFVRRLPPRRNRKHPFRWRPPVIARITFVWSRHQSALEEPVKPHDVLLSSGPR